MTTFARLVNGFALDCRVHATATELAACFHPEWLAANPFVVVPDGTIHGAKDNGNGTFTNPPPPPVPVPQPRAATRIEVIDAIPAAQWLAWRDTADAAAARQFARLNAADTITTAEWDALGNFLQTKAIFTAAQNTTFKAAKPVA